MESTARFGNPPKCPGFEESTQEVHFSYLPAPDSNSIGKSPGRFESGQSSFQAEIKQTPLPSGLQKCFLRRKNEFRLQHRDQEHVSLQFCHGSRTLVLKRNQDLVVGELQGIKLDLLLNQLASRIRNPLQSKPKSPSCQQSLTRNISREDRVNEGSENRAIHHP